MLFDIAEWRNPSGKLWSSLLQFPPLENRPLPICLNYSNLIRFRIRHKRLKMQSSRIPSRVKKSNAEREKARKRKREFCRANCFATFFFMFREREAIPSKSQIHPSLVSLYTSIRSDEFFSEHANRHDERMRCTIFRFRRLSCSRQWGRFYAAPPDSF